MSPTLSPGLGTLLSFLGVLALIPVALWVLRRTPMGAPGPVRVVASQQIGPQQRLLTLEVGAGESRQWLIVGVSAAGMQTLHTMVPSVASASATQPVASAGAQPLASPLASPLSFATHWARQRQAAQASAPLAGEARS